MGPVLLNIIELLFVDDTLESFSPISKLSSLLKSIIVLFC